MRDVLVYSLLRLALFAGIWWLLVAVTDLGLLMAGMVAALIAMLLSILFLRSPRERVARRWQSADERRRERRAERHDEDAEAEDALSEGEPHQQQH